MSLLPDGFFKSSTPFSSRAAANTDKTFEPARLKEENIIVLASEEVILVLFYESIVSDANVQVARLGK